MDKKAVSIIIPAYEPDEKLIDTISNLIEIGFSDILVVNDGSTESCNAIFEKVGGFVECTLVTHKVNKGKGAALKTAITYFMNNRPDKQCIVTADADGQHLAADIAAVARAALSCNKVVLGVRNFSETEIPARSIFGNRVTSVVFRLFFGMKIKDTQTGLRAFPRQYLPEILQAEGERYEYETNMLFLMNRKKIPFEQIEITTVYLEENQSSHFRVIRDSVRIYALILKYLLSSVLAAIVDELAFFIFKKIMFLSFLPIPVTFTAAFFARVVSSMVNFWVNAKHVFNEKVNRTALVKYYALAVVQIAVSASLVFFVEHIFKIASPAVSTIAKTIIDSILFFFSFRIQHKWVFNNKKAEGK